MLNAATSGSIKLSDVLPISDMQAKVDSGQVRVGEGQQQLDTWWMGLTPIEQKSPVNIAKFSSGNTVLARAGEIPNAADVALSNVNSTVQFSMNKRLKNKWNFLIGSQFQLNKHWMLRAECGFLSSRLQATTGLQYRFGL